MRLLSPSKPQLPLFQPLCRNLNSSKIFTMPSNSQFQSPLRTPPSGSSVQFFQQSEDEELKTSSEKIDDTLTVRRPEKKPSSLSEEVGSLLEADDDDDEEEEEELSGIEEGLNEVAKKMPLFEPLKRIALRPEERPLAVNLELALYRAKVLQKKFLYRKAEKILRRCIMYWPEDGRAYVALGKILCKKSKYDEARIVYETGCQAARGENPYIWQCWAVLENKLGNINRARELFDAATVADEKHVAAWHGWATLEIKEGNIKKARNLLGKGLKYCGANEYIYQTLALLEAKANRNDQARYLFQRATSCNPKSCASWLAWAQLEMQLENPYIARRLFEKAVQASPKNRFAWNGWAVFETKEGDTDKAKKLLKVGHILNPRDPVLLQSLALLEYRHSSANFARVLFNRASEIDPKHQPVWMAWGWMEWKEGNISKARELYRRALSIDPTTETAARCLQAWGVLEQRLGDMGAARRLFRSSLDINSQSYVTWMTWASLEEEQGNDIRAEEIRNMYFQQRTEIVDDDSWVMGFLEIIDPAVDSIKRILKLDKSSEPKEEDLVKLKSLGRRPIQGTVESKQEESKELILKPPPPSPSSEGHGDDNSDGQIEEINASEKAEPTIPAWEFNLDAFLRQKLSIDPSKLDAALDFGDSKRTTPDRKTWSPKRRKIPIQA